VREECGDLRDGDTENEDGEPVVKPIAV